MIDSQKNSFLIQLYERRQFKTYIRNQLKISDDDDTATVFNLTINDCKHCFMAFTGHQYKSLPLSYLGRLNEILNEITMFPVDY